MLRGDKAALSYGGGVISGAVASRLRSRVSPEREHRGAGLSYSPGIPSETMTLEQFIADTLAVSAYLRNRFSKEEIYLMAHSGARSSDCKPRLGRRRCTTPTLAWLMWCISLSPRGSRTSICSSGRCVDR